MKDLAHLPRAHAGNDLTPPEQPLDMPVQDFAAAFADTSAPSTGTERRVALWRLLAFSPAIIATAGLSLVMQGWFAMDGFMALEVLLLVLIAFNFFWISFSVSTVLLGLYRLWRRRPWQHSTSEAGQAKAMKIALLVPVHNEDPAAVCGNARTMLEDLYAWGGLHDYAMFILSDTRDERIAGQERLNVEALQSTLPPGIQLHYRRRAENTGRKAGNIADWVRRWGAGYEAMLVLDADSLMTGGAVAQLADALARDPGAGLIQSFPQLIEARSVFGRMQQFANGVYGLAMAEGLAAWVGGEGNYWGHNAILRTRAFAACAGLPPLRRLMGGEAQIMSHDFVEAGLLRRAGWSVRFMPWIEGSYEQTPPTLIDHIQRDRRWCQGNLQHLNLLGARGFKAVSRFHLLHGAVGYLMAPVWFALLVIWALIGKGNNTSALEYFSPANPLRPSWPDMSEPRHVAVILVIYAMLLAPKLLAIVAVSASGMRLLDFGGAGQFTLSLLSEILLAILYAPILMVQQMIAVFRSALRLQRGWAPQARDGGRYSLKTVAVTHGLETLCGVLLSAGILAGLVSLWLVPIAISLALAIPLSALSGLHLPAALAPLMGSRETFVKPQIIETAQSYRKGMAAYFAGQSGDRSAAE